MGPDFKKPAPPPVSGYTAQPLPAATASTNVEGGEAQHFANGADISGDWWTLYKSPALESLIAQALKNNPDLKAAQAALKSSHESALAGRGAFYPQLGLTASAFHYQQPGTLAPVPSNNAFQYNLFTPQLSVSYVPDVFGLHRRTVESLEAQAQAVRFQMIATYTTLITNVVVDRHPGSLGAAADRGDTGHDRGDQQVARDPQIPARQEAMPAAWTIPRRKPQLAAAAATLPPLIKQDAQLHDLLAVLVGRYPSSDAGRKTRPGHPEAAAGPAGEPALRWSRSVRTCCRPRPICTAASAQIGIAIANRLPNIT